MPRLRKYISSKTVVAVTTSLEEGLLLPANPLTKAIIESAMARAQLLHAVEINAYLLEANHIHFIMTVHDPENVSGFMGRFKTESSHAINRLLGRAKRTVWCEGYDSPWLPTVRDVMDRFVYLFTNPAKDNLDETIDRYPNVSTWKSFLKGTAHKSWCEYIRRPQVLPLERLSLPYERFARIASNLKDQAGVAFALETDPMGWLKAFDIYDAEEVKASHQKIIDAVREKEAEYSALRTAAGKHVMGSERLKSSSLDLSYRSERHGKKMWCICSDRALRKQIIRGIRNTCLDGAEVFREWSRGDFSRRIPPQLFAPCVPRVTSAYPLGLAALL